MYSSTLQQMLHPMTMIQCPEMQHYCHSDMLHALLMPQRSNCLDLYQNNYLIEYAITLHKHIKAGRNCKMIMVVNYLK